MEYTRLGNTGLNVSRICFGCMWFGKPGNGGIDEYVGRLTNNITTIQEAYS